MLRYDGMYIDFPQNGDGYYYMLRLFEEGKASGRMIQSNYTLEELYPMVYEELESKRNFEITIIGRNILLESNLIFDLKGTIQENELKLTGIMKNGKPWRDSSIHHYYFIPYNLILSTNRLWTIIQEKSPLSILIGKNLIEKRIYRKEDIEGYEKASSNYYYHIEENQESYSLDTHRNHIVVNHQKLFGFYLENHLFLLENLNESIEVGNKIIQLKRKCEE